MKGGNYWYLMGMPALLGLSILYYLSNKVDNDIISSLERKQELWVNMPMDVVVKELKNKRVKTSYYSLKDIRTKNYSYYKVPLVFNGVIPTNIEFAVSAEVRKRPTWQYSSNAVFISFFFDANKKLQFYEVTPYRVSRF